MKTLTTALLEIAKDTSNKGINYEVTLKNKYGINLFEFVEKTSKTFLDFEGNKLDLTGKTVREYAKTNNVIRLEIEDEWIRCFWIYENGVQTSHQ